MATELIHLPEGVKEFTANGREFIVHESLGFDGWVQFERLRVEDEMGASPGDMVKRNVKAIEALKKNDVYTTSIHLYNSTSTAERITAGRPHPRLLMLTLFCRPKGSDLTTWNESEAISWIEDFNKSGYDIEDFFLLSHDLRLHSAMRLLQGSRNIFGPMEESETPLSE